MRFRAGELKNLIRCNYECMKMFRIDFFLKGIWWGWIVLLHTDLPSSLGSTLCVSKIIHHSNSEKKTMLLVNNTKEKKKWETKKGVNGKQKQVERRKEKIIMGKQMHTRKHGHHWVYFRMSNFIFILLLKKNKLFFIEKITKLKISMIYSFLPV